MTSIRPRNLAAFERSQAIRGEIRSLLEAWPPIAPPLTSKRVRELLGLSLSSRTIRWHVQAVRSERETTLPLRQFIQTPR